MGGHRIPNKAFKGALDVMEAAWPKDYEHMAKISIHSMIGLWSRPGSTLHSVQSSMNEVDGAGSTTTSRCTTMDLSRIDVLELHLCL